MRRIISTLSPTRLARLFTSLIMALSLSLTACDGAEKDALTTLKDQKTLAPPLQIRAAPVEKRTVQDMIIGTGTIAARRTSNIGAAVEGIIDLIAVKVGDRVKEGDLLFQTRRVNYEITVARIESELALVEAHAEEASLEYKRVKQLYDRGNAPKARLDTAKTTRDAANANVAITTAKLNQAKQNLEDTIVRAPYTGVVTSRSIDEGVYRSVQIMGNDASVIQIQEISIVTAIVQVPESHLSQLALGGPALLTIDGISGPIKSAITIINDRVDLETRSVEIRFALQNPDYRIKPGLFVLAEITPEARPVLLIDRKAILHDHMNSYVFVSNSGRAVRRDVRIQDFDADRVEILSGLSEGEEIIIGPDLPLLTEGYQIREQLDVAS